jgi:hypothetical protein
MLTGEQLDFVTTFLSCEGNFREVEKNLGVSYPTVKNRLREILDVLNLKVKEDTVTQPNDEYRMEILQKLDNGEIDIEGALQLLSHHKEE